MIVERKIGTSELQTGIVLDVESARSLRDQLDKMLSTLDEEPEDGSH